MKATSVLIIACVVGYFLSHADGLALWPYGSPQNRWWQYDTYLFLHAGFLHLAINMIALLSFGPTIERAWGSGTFLACYLSAGILGGAVQSLFSAGPIVGASAAIFGLFAAYAMVKPEAKLLSVFLYSMRVRLVLALYIALSLLAIVMGWAASVAHVAHVVGALVGFAFWFAQEKAPAFPARGF